MGRRIEDGQVSRSRGRAPAWRRALGALAILGLGVAAPAADEVLPTRPVVGLALSGGSARGMAHAGVLRWLEEHRIPVDRIAGNSTGALMGAVYATGVSADDITTLLRNADWDTILRPDIPYPFRSFRRKEDDRDYAVKLEAGLLRGFRLQTGLNPGHHLSLLISRLLLPYSDVSSFDDLPIPFRCVATDLEKGETVVFDQGPIALAVRASMSLPGTYDPVRLDGRLFADGGILNNVPVDVARTMGAGIVIAVRVGPKAEELPTETIGGIANRAITLMMQRIERPRLEQADVVILPDVSDLSGGDFNKSDEFAARGYDAAERQSEALLRYALDDESWKKYRAALDARRRFRPEPVTFVQVRGVSGRTAAQIAEQLSRHIGTTPDPAEIERDLNRIVGLGHFASASYGRRDHGETTGLNVDIHAKTYGPPFVRFALDANNENRDINLNLGSRVTWMDVTGLGSEWRLDALVGSRLSLATELYQPVGGERPVHGGAFVSPRAAYTRTSENLYTDGELGAIYGRQRVGAGLDVGWNSGGSTRLRAGYDVAYVRNITRVGAALLPRSAGAEQAARARFEYDGQDAAYFPSRGMRVTTTAQWFLEAPDAPKRFGILEGSLSAARPLATTKTLTFTLDGGAAFTRTPPILYQFTLGGPFRLGAFPTDAFRGPKYLLGTLGYRFPVGRLPKFLGGRVSVSTRVEVGSAFDDAADARVATSFSAGLSADTLLGPFFAGGSVGRDGARVYVNIGRLVR